MNLFTFDGKLELQIAYNTIIANKYANKFADNNKDKFVF